MSVRLGCIADDYTGASDLANTLTKCGQRTLQTIGIPAGGFSAPDADAVVVSLKIRSIAAAEAGGVGPRGGCVAQGTRRTPRHVQNLFDL